MDTLSLTVYFPQLTVTAQPFMNQLDTHQNTCPPDNRPAAATRLRCCALIVIATFSVHAEAYIDPGSGSFLLQILIAGFVGAMFYFRQGVEAAKRFFGRVFGKKQ